MNHSASSGSYNPPRLASRDITPVRRRQSNPETLLIEPRSVPVVVDRSGRPLIPPNCHFARAVVMGNEVSTSAKKNEEREVGRRNNNTQQRPASNLTLLLSQSEQQQEVQTSLSPTHRRVDSRGSQHSRGLHASVDEADSASGPATRLLGSSAPLFYDPQPVEHVPLSRQNSTGDVGPVLNSADRVRRCLSSKELKTIAPPSGSPYALMLHQKEQLESSMRERLQALRHNVPETTSPESSSNSARRHETANELRNKRRAEHNQAVVDDLCNIVADLFLAESKLLNLTTYGVSEGPDPKEQVIESVRTFLSALPPRYALSADTPSEVLLHMRLMAAVRAGRNKVVIHIHNLTGDTAWTHPLSVPQRKQDRSVRLVTISCVDASGLLEYISRLLATGGSRVLDADVMLTKDGIVLDRFVVEMNGRLRLDKLSDSVEAFLRDTASPTCATNNQVDGENATPSPTSPADAGGPLYFHREVQQDRTPMSDIQKDMEGAVPFTEVLASSNQLESLEGPAIPQLRRLHSIQDQSSSPSPNVPNVRLSIRRQPSQGSDTLSDRSSKHRRQLVNRPATSNLDNVGIESVEPVRDYMTIPASDGTGTEVENRVIPLIPFDEIMLIETLGAGRVSTIYRAAWQRVRVTESVAPIEVQMIALKVAMMNTATGDASHVDELRREADIAARLNHPNICDLVGVAADSDCFCLAYDYCEGGSLLSLLSDSSRYYEYLPIALDIANGMAYLHSRNVIHRDLKPSNILLTRDHRAKISDFGMSVANTGQELTAETGTYRYMAPEVIRHESYSSNADVYSFGICLWQLITREIPFATMTPIQAAYSVAEGRRPEIPPSTPRRLQEIIVACWDQDSHRRPSFTYIAMALADYAKMAFSPANVGALTLSIANEMLATVEGNSTVNVDFTTPVGPSGPFPMNYQDYDFALRTENEGSQGSDVGLAIE